MTEENTMLQADEAPRLRRGDLHRLSEGANGINLWGYVTAHSLSQVLAPGYFVPAAGWLARHDRILVTAAAESRRPAHVTLVVAAMPARGPRVQRLRA